MIIRGFNTIYDDAGNRVPFRYSGSNAFMSGRWRRRDGDTYGNIAPQPPIKLAEPEAGWGELKNANDPSGHLRSTSVSRD